MPGNTDAGRLGQAMTALESADEDDGAAVKAWLVANTPPEPEEDDDADDDADDDSDGDDDDDDDDDGDGS